MIYFISDLHLGLGDAGDVRREQLFRQWLKLIARDATALYIVGDLFDYWFEYRTVIPAPFYRVLAAFADLVESGVHIHYIIGNHDFGHWRFFQHAIGAVLHWEDVQTEIHGKKFYIAHGDGKLEGDRGYLLLRKILRNPLAQRLYRWIHPDIGIWLASLSSRASRKHTERNNPRRMDYLFHFAKQKIEEGFDFVILGHQHLPQKKVYQQGVYINLGDWLEHDSFARFDGETVELLQLRHFLNPSVSQLSTVPV